jgi:hypothetical protein
MDALQRRAVIYLIALIVLHTGLLLLSGYLLYSINLSSPQSLPIGEVNQSLWINTGLIGFSGSLLYFSRKIYVYLITNKIFRIQSEAEAETELPSTDKESRYRARLIGYYLYLAIRPLGGLAIGPLVTMIILGGITTLSKTASLSSAALSPAGVFIVYVFSFIGGYTSSDLFDYLSKAGGRLLTKGNDGEPV